RSPVTRKGSDLPRRDPVSRSSSHSRRASETKKVSNESHRAPEGKTSQASPPNESRKAAEEKRRETPSNETRKELDGKAPSQALQSSNQQVKPANEPSSKSAIVIADEPSRKSAEPPKASANQSASLPNPPAAPALSSKKFDEPKSTVQDSKNSEGNSNQSNSAASTKGKLNIESAISKAPKKALNESPSSNAALPCAAAAPSTSVVYLVNLVDDAVSPTKAATFPLPSRPISALPAKPETNASSSSLQRSGGDHQKSQSKTESVVPSNTHQLPPVPPKSANQPASSSKAEGGGQVQDLREKLLSRLKRKAEEGAETTDKQSKPASDKIADTYAATDTPKKSQKFSASSSPNVSLNNNLAVSNTTSTSSVPSPKPITFRLGGSVAPAPYKLPPPPPPVNAPSVEPSTRVPISLRLGGKMDSRDGDGLDSPRSTGPKDSRNSRPDQRYAPLENSQPRYYTQSFSQPGAYMSTYDTSPRQGSLPPFRLPYLDERGSRGGPSDRNADPRYPVDVIFDLNDLTCPPDFLILSGLSNVKLKDIPPLLNWEAEDALCLSRALDALVEKKLASELVRIHQNGLDHIAFDIGTLSHYPDVEFVLVDEGHDDAKVLLQLTVPLDSSDKLVDVDGVPANDAAFEARISLTYHITKDKRVSSIDKNVQFSSSVTAKLGNSIRVPSLSLDTPVIDFILQLVETVKMRLHELKELVGKKKKLCLALIAAFPTQIVEFDSVNHTSASFYFELVPAAVKRDAVAAFVLFKFFDTQVPAVTLLSMSKSQSGRFEDYVPDAKEVPMNFNFMQPVDRNVEDIRSILRSQVRLFSEDVSKSSSIGFSLGF
ncbi:hypothetical protein HDU81_007098, partial [Chytriomyces hyalinus]